MIGRVFTGAVIALGLGATPVTLAQAQGRNTANAAGQTATASGKDLFQARCAACHDDKGFATRILARRVPEGQAVLDTRKNLNRQFIHLIVRQGTGSMPQIRKSELPDADLDAIAAYLEKGR